MCVLLLLLLFFLSALPKYWHIRSKKIFYRPPNSYCSSVICSYKNEIFRVSSFSKQVAAKGNSPGATWQIQTPVYLISLKWILSSGQKPVYTVKILLSEQIVFTAALYFGQVFVFCKLINESELDWCLLMCK